MSRAEQKVRDLIRGQYEKHFNIFQVKSLNSILSNSKTKESIDFYDMRFDGDEIEYLKRYYMTNESLVRVLKLISILLVKRSQDYYECNLTPPQPSFITLPSFKVMSLRHRKILKLQEQKEQSLAKKREGKLNEPVLIEDESKENILHHLQASNLSDIDDKDEECEINSFDSQVHDIYDPQGSNSIEYKFRVAFSCVGSQQNIFDLKAIKQGNLIIDFKQQLPKLAESNKLGISEQMQLKQSNKVSVLNGKPQFIKMSSPEQRPKKKNSFMGYYNSLSKKESSTILDKYIKDKK